MNIYSIFQRGDKFEIQVQTGSGQARCFAVFANLQDAQFVAELMDEHQKNILVAEENS